QGKYWEMHDLVFEKYNKLTEEMFSEFAEKLKLDMTKFTADFKSAKYDKQIEQDINLGRKVGVSGTPTLFMNGKRMRNRNLSDFKTAIDGYLKKK
ncbi:MAG: DsbA family protein, partial [Nitrospirota bacterium]